MSELQEIKDQLNKLRAQVKALEHARELQTKTNKDLEKNCQNLEENLRFQEKEINRHNTILNRILKDEDERLRKQPKQESGTPHGIDPNRYFKSTKANMQEFNPFMVSLTGSTLPNWTSDSN